MLGRFLGNFKKEEKETASSLIEKKDTVDLSSEKKENASLLRNRLRELEEKEIAKKSFRCERDVPRKINYIEKEKLQLFIPGKSVTKVVLLNDELTENVTLSHRELSWWRQEHGEWKKEDLFLATEKIYDVVGNGKRLVVADKNIRDFNLFLLEKDGQRWKQKILLNQVGKRLVSMAINEKTNAIAIAVADAKNKFELIGLEEIDGHWKQEKKIKIYQGESFNFFGRRNEMVLCSAKDGNIYFYRDWLREGGAEVITVAKVCENIAQADFVGKNSIISVTESGRLVLFNIKYSSVGRTVSSESHFPKGDVTIMKLLGLSDGRFITSEKEGKVRIWRIDSIGNWINSCIPDGYSNNLACVSDLHILKDGMMVTVDRCSEESFVRVWKGSDGI